MSSGGANIEFYSKMESLVKDMDRLTKKQQEMVQNFDKVGRSARKGGSDAEKATAAAAREMDRFAAATMKVNQTPLERYKEEVFKLNTALKAGKIDQESFNRAVERAKATLEQTKAILQQTGTEMKRTGAEEKNAFSQSSISRLASYTAGLAGIAAAAALARKVLSEVRTEAEQIGDKQFTEAPSLGMLAQVADTPEDLARLEAEAKKTFAEGGARTIPEAAKLQFALESGSAGALRADFSQLQASGLVPDAAMMAESAIKLIAGMGEQEAGDFRTVVSKAFGGAKLGLGSAEELLQATASVSSQASRLGLSDEEVMAAVSTVSAVEGPAEASTQIQALLKGIEVEGIGGGFLEKGKTLREQVAKLKELETQGVDIRDMLGGRQEAVKGYGQLSSERGVASVEANLANIASAEREDWFGKKVTMAEGIPVNAAALLARQRKNQAELNQEEVGIYENLADSVAADQKEYQRQRYGGGFIGDIAAAGEGVGIGAHRFFAGNRSFVNSGLNEGTSEQTRAAALTIEAAMDLREAAAQQRAASEESATRRQRAAASAQPE